MKISPQFLEQLADHLKRGRVPAALAQAFEGFRRDVDGAEDIALAAPLKTLQESAREANRLDISAICNALLERLNVAG